MNWDLWGTLGVLAITLLALIGGLAGTDVIMLGATTALLTLGIISPSEAFSGFANEGTLTVAVLFVVGAAVRDTGGIHGLAYRFLGNPRTLGSAQLRLLSPVTLLSSFFNNTPVVAMLVPIVSDWSRRIGISKSKLLMPLSYAAILGGTCTLIGHSTNLVVAAMLSGYDTSLTIGMFELAWVGVPLVIVGILYMIVFSRWLLPEPESNADSERRSREYTVAMRVQPNSVVIGQSIEEAGLRHLPGLYLVEIERDGEVMPAVGPHRKLRAGDELLFAGIVDSVVDLQKIKGLVPATTQVDKLAESKPNRRFVEAVVATHSPLIGKSIRETHFRSVYYAAVIAVHRQGERVRSKIGDIVLRAGDTLLLEARPTFLSNNRHNDSFALVSEVQNSAHVRFEKAWVSVSIVICMVLANAFGLISLLHAAMLAVCALLLTRCITGADARKAIDLPVVLTIAGAFGVGAAVDKSGLATAMSTELLAFAKPLGTTGLLAAIYIVTALLGSVVTTKAAAVLMFPVITSVAASTGIDLKLFVMLLIFASAGNFITPIAYQTNLMVYGPGGYRFADFLRFGAPLQILVAIVTIALAHQFWG